MPKGYGIVNNSVRDPDGYEDYKAAAAGPLTRHGARFVCARWSANGGRR